MSLVGKNALVTGAASGIGRASAIRLAQDGADIAILDLNAEGLEQTGQLVEAEGKRCVAITVDLLDREALKAAFDEAKAELGFLEILHANAGGATSRDVRSFRKSKAEQWDHLIALNLTVASDCTRQVINDMVEQQAGRIIITSSEQAFRGGPGFTDYSAAKAGLLGFARSLAQEVGHHGITVNAVCPGVTRTPLVDAMPREHIERSIQSIPVGRIAEPEDIAHAVSFFASPGAWYVTGEYLLVTGGRTMH